MEKSPSWETNKSSASQEIPKLYKRRRFLTAFTVSRQLSLSWLTAIQSMPPHPTYCRFILIFSYHLCVGLPSGLLPSGPLTKPLYIPLLSPLRATCPAHFILLDLITQWPWVRNTQRNASRYVVYSSALSRRTRPRIVARKIRCYASGASITKMTLLYRQSRLYRLFCGATDLTGPRPPHGWGFEIAHSHTASGRTPLCEWSARRRDLFLTTHNIHKRQTSMSLARFEPAVPLSKLPQTDALDSASTGIGRFSHIPVENSRLNTLIVMLSNSYCYQNEQQLPAPR